MKLDSAAFCKLAAGTFTADTVGQIVTQLHQSHELTGAVPVLNLDFETHLSEFGNLIPFITIGLRPCTNGSSESQTESSTAPAAGAG